MTSGYKILATPHFKLSLGRLGDFLSRKYSVEYTLENKTRLQEKISSILSEQPKIAPISARLLELGVSDYRQWFVDEHNLVFYRVIDEESTVVLLLVMDSRQDVQKLLYELALLK